MDLLTQVLLVLVFVLSVALFVRSGAGSSSASVASSQQQQQQQKKKQKKKSPAVARTAPSAAVEAAPVSSAASVTSASEVEEDASVPSATLASASSSKSKSKAAKRRAKKAAAAAEAPAVNGTVPHGVNGTSSDAVVADDHVAQLAAPVQNGSAAPSSQPFTPNGSFTIEDFEPAEEPQEEEIWTSVGGKGAGRLNAIKSGAPGAGNASPSPGATSSFASANPFAVLPSGGGNSKSSATQGRSISIPSIATTNGGAAKSNSSAASTAEQTKRQRQNAARQAAAKAEKQSEERERQARLDAHRREARLAAAREEERKKATKVARSTGGPVGGSKQPTSSASVNLQGQLVWE